MAFKLTKLVTPDWVIARGKPLMCEPRSPRTAQRSYTMTLSHSSFYLVWSRKTLTYPRPISCYHPSGIIQASHSMVINHWLALVCHWEGHTEQARTLPE